MLSKERIDELAQLQKNLGYTFENILLLNKALTHKSYVNEKSEAIKNNERFEFLGDSVLDMIVSHYMVKTFQDFSEGLLSKIRAAVVNEACLAGLAREVHLGDYLLLGRGEDLTGGRDKNSILANAFEAVAGAIYFDSNLETAYDILLPKLKKEIAQYAKTSRFRDFKSELQHFSQNTLNCIPFYKVVKESGPDHEKQFEVAVRTNGEEQGRGVGRSKKEAEQAAARNALERLNSDFQSNGT